MKKCKIFLILVVCFFVFFRWYVGTKTAFDRAYCITSSEVEIVKTKPFYEIFITDIGRPTWTIFKFEKGKKSIKEIFVFNEKEIFDDKGLKFFDEITIHSTGVAQEVEDLFKDCKDEDIDFIEYRGISESMTFIINLKTGYGAAIHAMY